MHSLIQQLIAEGYLKTPAIINAFKKIKRQDFLPDKLKAEAGANAPLPVGFDQTNSQPLTVAFMLELLQPNQGDKALDIGSGSGWTSALLAEIVGEKGKVYAIERIPELVDFAKSNVAKYKFKNLELNCADGAKGYNQEAPYDKILASAAAEEIPLAWKKQIKVGGIIVAPVGNSIWRLVKKLSPRGFVFEETEYPGFIFVPLI